MAIVRQSANLGINSFTVYSYAIYFNCKAVAQTYDDIELIRSRVTLCLMLVFDWTKHGSIIGFL